MVILQSLENCNYERLSTIQLGPIIFNEVVEPFANYADHQPSLRLLCTLMNKLFLPTGYTENT
jgi:hypothetical protein